MQNAKLLTDIILGDMRDDPNGHRGTCSPAITDLTAAFFRAQNLSVSLNGNDFRGGALIQTTGKPDHNRHSLQIEIARDLIRPDDYCDGDDPRRVDPVKLERMASLMADLAATLSDYMTARTSGSPNTPAQLSSNARSSSSIPASTPN